MFITQLILAAAAVNEFIIAAAAVNEFISAAAAVNEPFFSALLFVIMACYGQAALGDLPRAVSLRGSAHAQTEAPQSNTWK